MLIVVCTEIQLDRRILGRTVMSFWMRHLFALCGEISCCETSVLIKTGSLCSRSAHV